MTTCTFSLNEQNRLVKTLKGKVGIDPMDFLSWVPEISPGWKRTGGEVDLEGMTFEITDIEVFPQDINIIR